MIVSATHESYKHISTTAFTSLIPIPIAQQLSRWGTLFPSQGVRAVKRFSLLLSKHNPSCIYLHIYLHFAVFLVRKEQTTSERGR